MNISTTLKAAALALALPVSAQAATIAVNNSDIQTLRSGAAYAETWSTNGNTYAISAISFTINGTYAKDDIPNVYVSRDGGTTKYNDWFIFSGGNQSIGYLFLDGFTTSSDFTITMDYTSGSSTLLATYLFTAEEITPPLPAVPVPAAGILLVSALAGLGVAKRRRNKA
ncbi:VPLPA-CTERM sorting domain-containing protein [Sinirhodobacter populi]|uniref:VPLPA-CTERM sorting domain-containing protein n=1 Tax=Paenirhodobacter populi TaxID=2306993 RepID=A0A443K190_9RHOB|nr:VPLPA-CTERM sorting domain-containing protein [Sinirhodobacter populi]RWR26517.1 VPLPA-CTERM sorting domain-containing protein [Sinirhodobacter populi]